MNTVEAPRKPHDTPKKICSSLSTFQAQSDEKFALKNRNPTTEEIVFTVLYQVYDY